MIVSVRDPNKVAALKIKTCPKALATPIALSLNNKSVGLNLTNKFKAFIYVLDFTPITNKDSKNPNLLQYNII